MHRPLFAPCVALVLALFLAAAARAAGPAEIRIGYLRIPELKAAISLLDVPPDNDGVAGALLAIGDNNTTGRFLDQKFLLEEVRLSERSPGSVALSGAIAPRRHVGREVAQP